MTCNTQFEGVFCPSITITNADGTIDYDNWGKHLEHLIDAERISYLMRLYDTADLFISAIKGAVKAKGLPIDTSIHEPAVQLTDEQYRNIQSILK